MVKKLWDKKVVRFISIGLVNTGTDLAILNLMVFAFGLKLIIANVISASISISLSYFWNHFIVFRHQKPVTIILFLRFFVITGVGILAIQTVVIFIIEHTLSVKQISDLLGISSHLSKIIRVNSAKVLAVLVSMIWNYFLYKTAVFKDVPEQEPVVPY